MRQVKRIVEELELNSMQANLTSSLSVNSQSVSKLQERERITENKAARLTPSFDKSDRYKDAPSRTKLQHKRNLNRQIQASQQLAEANEKLVKDAIERENQYLAFLEKTFAQVESQKPEQGSDLAEDNIESKKSIQNLMIQSLERLANFEQIRLNLGKVIGDIRMAQSQIQLDALTPSHPKQRWLLNPRGARSAA